MHCGHHDGFKSTARSQGSAPGGAALTPAAPTPATRHQRAAALAQVWGHRGQGGNPRGSPASLGQALAAAGRDVSVPMPTVPTLMVRED